MMFFVGMKVVCSVPILCYHFYSNVTLQGEIKAMGPSKIMVDFSKDPKNCSDKPLDYQKILVDKNECVEAR